MAKRIIYRDAWGIFFKHMGLKFYIPRFIGSYPDGCVQIIRTNQDDERVYVTFADLKGFFENTAVASIKPRK